MMLPPFVPPSARGKREALPSITEFISATEERSFSTSGMVTAPVKAQSPGESLPNITDFLVDQPSLPRQEGLGFDSGWLEDERNAFDWQAVSVLAIRQNEERRAEEEWTATSWEKPTDSTEDHIAAMLLQVARRVRAGELHIDGTSGMSAEAALAATLAALLQADG